MGVYDVIHFDKSYLCPNCKEKISSIQVKEFENTFENYHIKDCVSHAEDFRIIKDELFCNHCLKHIGKNIYILVNRGILVGIAESLEEGKDKLEINLEKLILWYHDQYHSLIKEKAKKNSYKKFLSEIVEWYGEKFDEEPPTGLKAIRFSEFESHFKSTKNPIETIGSFLAYEKMKEVLDDLWKEGMETLDIYYPEDMQPGEEKWSVDVFQDDINERCGTNWTWTVINRKDLEEEEKEEEMPEWEIIVDEPFSEDLVINVIKGWLKDRGYKFDLRMISLEDARGSGMIKTLRERLKNEDFVKYEIKVHPDSDDIEINEVTK